ncbi:MAG: SDR family NAD(P)-dependent oxidoreductase [Bacteroidales bacterium]|nr:SDR family NAD(P)-dependent oxidoreductase [Bacteroidales bacterium]
MKETVIVTGATGGMGFAAVDALAAKGCSVIMACRNRAKAEVARSNALSHHPKAEIEISEVDLSSLDSVKSLADSVRQGTVTGLFNNAGIISRDYCLTADGFEKTFAVNYFAPWLLTRLLADKLADGAHIVNMISLTCRYADISVDRLQPSRKDFRQLKTYAASKRALLSFSLEFARRYPQFVVNVADPGVVGTGMIDLGHWYDSIADAIFKPLCKKPENGVKPALHALESEQGVRYFVGKGSHEMDKRYLDSALDSSIWDATEHLLENYL